MPPIPRTIFLLLLPVMLWAQASQRYVPITIPMRDGQSLAADLYSTDSTVAKPVILVQTPYNKNYYRVSIFLPQAGGTGFPFDSVHYHYVILDWRGFYGSKDETEQFFQGIQAGVTYANRPQGATTGAWPGFQPFGGWKGSGSTGKNSGGHYYLPLYMHEQIQTRVE